MDHAPGMPTPCGALNSHADGVLNESGHSYLDRAENTIMNKQKLISHKVEA